MFFDQHFITSFLCFSKVIRCEVGEFLQKFRKNFCGGRLGVRGGRGFGKFLLLSANLRTQFNNFTCFPHSTYLSANFPLYFTTPLFRQLPPLSANFRTQFSNFTCFPATPHIFRQLPSIFQQLRYSSNFLLLSANLRTQFSNFTLFPPTPHIFPTTSFHISATPLFQQLPLTFRQPPHPIQQLHLFSGNSAHYSANFPLYSSNSPSTPRKKPTP